MRSFFSQSITAAVIIVVALQLGACGSSEPELDFGEDFTESDLRLKAFFTEENPQPFGQIPFEWDAVEGADFYRFFEDRDGDSDNDGEPEFVQVGADIPAATDPLEAVVDISAHLFDWPNARFMLESCIGTTCTEVGRQSVARLSAAYIAPLVGIGFNVAYAENGTTMAVGSPGTSTFLCEELIPVELAEDFDTECEYLINLDDPDDIPESLNETIVQAGSVVILVLENNVWVQQATLVADEKAAGDLFGSSVAISDDGNTVAVSALGEDGGSTGVGGDETDNTEVDSGAAYIFMREQVGDEFVWTQTDYIKPSNTQGDPDLEDLFPEGDRFGNSIALASDGLTLVVTAWGEDSNSLLIDAGQDNNDAASAGAAYVFSDTAGTWAQQAYLKPSNAAENDLFGTSSAISATGDHIAIGAINESSAALADPFNDAAPNAGAVYVFARSGSAWSQQAFVKPEVVDALDEFGFSVAFNGAGDRLAVGAPQDDSNAIGVGGSETNNEEQNTGAAYLFALNAGTWEQVEFFKASNADPIDEMGFVVRLNHTGDKLLATAVREGSNSVGINGPEALDFAVDSGAGYLFVESGGEWEQLAFIKAARNGSQVLFGWDADFAQDGQRLAIAAFGSSTVFVH